MTPLLAYVCENADGEDQEILFATSSTAARRAQSSAKGCSADSLDVRRAPEFDSHAPGPVPFSALFDRGWYLHCHSCDRRISSDDQFIEDVPHGDLEAAAAKNARILREIDAFNAMPLAGANPQDRRMRLDELQSRIIPHALSRKALRIGDAHAFCDARCEQDHIQRIASVNAAHQAAEESAATRWPGAPSYVSGRWPFLNPHVRFRPPGFEYDVVYNADADAAHPVNADAERWESYLESLGGEPN